MLGELGYPAGVRAEATSLSRYQLEPALNTRRSRYKSRPRGTTNIRPHHRPVAQSTTTITAIHTASSSRITSDDFRCLRSQLIRSLRYDYYEQTALGIP